MAIGPNDLMAIVASEVARLEKEFDKAIARAESVAITEITGSLIIGICTQVPQKEIIGLVESRLEKKYEDAGWRVVTVTKRDDSSMALALLK